MFLRKYILTILFLVSAYSVSFAQVVPASQQAGGQEAQRQQQETEKKLREQLRAKPVPVIVQPEQELTPQSKGVQSSQKVLIKTITVTGNTILSKKEIEDIISPSQGKKMSLQEMQKVADQLTDTYRRKGFITTRAILPPQQVTNNLLEIKIVQGVMGDVYVRGNRFFKKSLYTKEVTLKKGALFNYNQLRNDLNTINQLPDRYVKTVITPGKEPGQTDVLLDVKDRLPIHVAFSYDNYASQYIAKNRYTGRVTDNNLLGFGDVFSFQYQQTEMNAYRLYSFRYVFPVFDHTQIGFSVDQNDLTLQEEFKALQARGKTKVYSVFVNQDLISDPNLKFSVNVGFDYKDVFNFQLGEESSRDRLRGPKAGFNLDYTDKFNGRNIINDELSFGIPNIMGGMRDTDPRSSRVGAGGQYVKDQLDVLRLQWMPFDTTLLLKGQAQFAGSILPAIEQYQLGGIANVRGFAPGEAVGDNGQSATAELGIPVYFIPRGLKIPFCKARLYDALRVSAFYDWGHVTLRNPQVGEPQSRILDSFGTGIRLNLPDKFFFRLDIAWPVNGRPSDGHNEHTWVQISKEF